MNIRKSLQKVRLLVPANNAKVAPPLGPVLGQFGINIMLFCKQFNEQTQSIKKDILLPVIFILYKDKSFKFSYSKPTISFLVKQLIYNSNIKFQRYMQDNNNKEHTSEISKILFYNNLKTNYYIRENKILYNHIIYYSQKVLNKIIFKNYFIDLKQSRLCSKEGNHINMIKYSIILKSFLKSLEFQIKQFALKTNFVEDIKKYNKYLYIEQIYKIVIFKFGLSLTEIEYFYLCRNILGTLKSMEINII